MAWFGLFAPAGTPRSLINKLAADVTRLMKYPQIKSRFESQSAEPVDNSSSEAFMKLLRSENVRYARLIKEAGMQLQ